MAQITSSGIGSGLDISGLVQQLVAAERQPLETRLNRKAAETQTELSALGSLKSAVESFTNSLSRLEEPGLYTGRTVSGEDSDVFTVTVEDDAVPGRYDVEVETLATRHKIASSAYTDSDTSVGTGQLSFSNSNDSFSIDVESGADSLADIRDAINSAEDNFGVTASIIQASDGAHLVFTSNDPGEDYALSVAATTDVSDTGDLSKLRYDANNPHADMTEKTEAVNSQIRVDGFLQSVSGFEVDNAVQGMTFSLVDAQPGEIFTVEVEEDKGSVRAEIASFVGSYNRLRGTINGLGSYDAETGRAGALQGDSLLRSLSGDLRELLSAVVPDVDDSLDTLAELGITTNPDDGTLELDSDQLTEVMDNQFDKLSALFLGDSGLVQQFSDRLASFTDEDDGILNSREARLESRMDGYEDQQEVIDRRIAVIEARYQQQFLALDTLMGELTSTGDFLSTQLQNLPGVVREDK